MASAQKVSLYSLSELKATLDDHLPIYLTSPNTPSNAPLPKSARFNQTYFLTYVRLALGYAAVLVTAGIFYLDYVAKWDWKDTKLLVWIAVPTYFALSGALTLFQWYGEKGVIFTGTRVEKSATTSLRVESHHPRQKYDPIYRLTASWDVSGDLSKSGHIDFSAPFTKFFTADGYFAPIDFEAWLRHEIPVVATPSAKMGKVEVIQPQEASLLDPGNGVMDADGNITAHSTGQVIQSQRGDTVLLTTSPKKRGRPKKDSA